MTPPDQGPPFSLRLRDGVRSLRLADELVSPGPSGSIWVLGWGYFGGSFRLTALGSTTDYATTFTGFWEPEGEDIRGEPVFGAVDPFPSAAEFRLDPLVAGGPITLTAPMGLLIGDLGGGTDLVVTTSAELLPVFTPDGAGGLVDISEVRNARFGRLLPDDSGATTYKRIKPWGGMIADLDRDGAQDILLVAGEDESDFDQELPGDNTPVLFLRRGDVFVHATAEAGLLAPINGRSLVVGDLDLDGRPDAIFGGVGTLPQVVLNRVDGPRLPIGLRLIGTTSGAFPTGATVRITDDGVPGPLLVIGGNHNLGPFSEPVAFGTTVDDSADSIEIRWPSGLVQVVEGLAAGTTHTITEPSWLEIDPAGRHATRDAVVHLRVTPRDLSGAPRAAVVQIGVHAGDAVLDGPPVADGLTWVQAVRGPVGSAVFDITIDGVPMGVRPRVWWE
jgi:hypothetical protein